VKALQAEELDFHIGCGLEARAQDPPSIRRCLDAVAICLSPFLLGIKQNRRPTNFEFGCQAAGATLAEPTTAVQDFKRTLRAASTEPVSSKLKRTAFSKSSLILTLFHFHALSPAFSTHQRTLIPALPAQHKLNQAH
jgi:hypothetical protein